MLPVKSPKKNIDWKEFLPASFILFNSLTWFVLVLARYTETVSGTYSTIDALFIFIIHYSGIAISAVAGAIVFPRSRKLSLSLWILLGAVMSSLLGTIADNTLPVNLLISFFLGVSFGMGLPSALAYFGDVTSVESRGFRGGLVWSVVGLGTLVLVVGTSSLSLAAVFVVSAVWRGVGLVAFLGTRKAVRIQPRSEAPGFLALLRRRDVLLYLVPWVMFCLVNFTVGPMLEPILGEFFTLVQFIEFAVAAPFALVGGFLADIVGRKRVVMTGFVVLGLGYAVLGVFSSVPFSWYVYTVLDGIAWGMFAAVFFMTLWGDLVGDQQKERPYLIGGLPYVLLGFLSILVEPYVSVIPLSTAFSLASFFLFLAVIPLMYAPETLPEKRIKDIELKGYVEKAKKIKEKYA